MRRVVLGLAAGLVLGGIAGAPASARDAQCLNLTQAQRTSVSLPASPRVSCDQPHTAEVLGTVSLPAGVAARSARVQRAWAFRACHKVAVKRVLGPTATVLPKAAYALPRTAQLSAYLGKGRATCVGFNTSATGTVTPRVGTVAGTGLSPHVCLDDRTWRFAPCSQRRSVPMTNVVWLSDGLAAGYPGAKKALRQTLDLCLRLGAPAKLEPNAWYSYGVAAWEQGDRFGYCQMSAEQWDSGWQVGDES